MIIVGAKGFAKELLEVCHQLGQTQNLVFFDNVSNDLPDKLFNEFSVLRTETEVKEHFAQFGNQFVLGLGNPHLRKKMSDQFEAWGGELTTIISPFAALGKFNLEIAKGATILANCSITTNVKIGRGLLMYPNAIITHECTIGDFVELSPGATLLGNCSIGDLTHIGANATVLPNVKVGERVLVGAGAVVHRVFPDSCVLAGVPAKIIRHIN